MRLISWNTPRAWASLELVTAGNMNTYISDLLSYLKGSVGPVVIDNNLGVSGTFNSTGSISGGNVVTTATGASIAMRDGNADLWARYFNMTADDQTTTIPSSIVGRNGSEQFLRWYNETNWQRDGGIVRQSGSYDLGAANAAGNTGRKKDVHAEGGALTVSCTGSAAIVIGINTAASSVVIASGDSYTFRADASDNKWVVV